MQAKNLTVLGSSRLLGKIYCNDLEINGSSAFNGDLGVSGKATVGQLHVTSVSDIAGNSNTTSVAPVLIGAINGTHLEIDQNEIHAKASANTTTSLFLNDNGGEVHLSGRVIASGGTISAENGTFSANVGAVTITNSGNIYNRNGIIETDEIKSNVWDIVSVQNLGGDFYVCPTIVVTNNSVFRIGSVSGNTIVGTLVDSTNITGESFGGHSWTSGSKIKITGKLTSGSSNYVLGVCDGTLTANMNTTSGAINFSVTCNASTVPPAGNYTISEGTVMMYNVGGSDPVGIHMTSYGSNKVSYIDIYDGSNGTSPKARIGKLDGLGAVNDMTPTGYGIYTDNGYFAGVVVAKGGKVGGSNITTSSLYSGSKSAYNSSNSGYYLGSDGKFGVGTSTNYVAFDGTNLNIRGTLYLSGGTSVENKIAEEISNIEVGGRNLLLNTGRETASKLIHYYTTTNGGAQNYSLSFNNGETTLTSTSASGEHYVRFCLINSANNVFADFYSTGSREWVFSGYVKSSFANESSYLSVRAQEYDLSAWHSKLYLTNLITGEEVGINSGTINILTGSHSDWVRFAVKITIPDDVDITAGYISLQQYGTFTVGDTFTYKQLKLELGNKATDWTPAPEDIIEDAVNNLEVGGRNLLLGTSEEVSWTVSLNSSNYGVKDCYMTVTPVPTLFEENDLVTISFDWESTATSGNFHLECGKVTPYVWGTVVNSSGTRSTATNYVDITPTNQLGHVAVTFRITSAVVAAAETLQWMRIRVDGIETSGTTFTVSNAKLERGNKATDWTAAPEDVTSSTNTAISDAITNGLIDVNSDIDDLKKYNVDFLREYNEYVEKTADSIGEVDDKIVNYISAQKDYLSYGTEGGIGTLTLGSTSNSSKLKLTNSQMAFVVDNQVTTYISGNIMHVNNVDAVNSLRLGSFAFVPMDNGSLSFGLISDLISE